MFCNSVDNGHSCSSGLDSTYVYGYQGALLPVELSQRHPLLFLRKVSKPQLTLTLGQPKTFKAAFDLRRHSLCIVSQWPPGVHRLRSHGWALLPLPWDVAVWPTSAGCCTPPAISWHYLGERWQLSTGHIMHERGSVSCYPSSEEGISRFHPREGLFSESELA